MEVNVQTSALVRLLVLSLSHQSVEFLKCGSVLCIPGSLSPGCVLGVYVRNVLNVWNVKERIERIGGRGQMRDVKGLWHLLTAEAVN